MTVTGSETHPRLRPAEHLADRAAQDSPTPDVRARDIPAQDFPAPRPWRPSAPPPLTAGERLLLAAERAVGRLAPTLRIALVMLIAALAGIAVVAATAGLLAAVLCTLVLVVLALIRR